MDLTYFDNIEKREKLEKLYNQAGKEKKIQFEYEHNVLLTDYAKYLLEHLKNTYKS